MLIFQGVVDCTVDVEREAILSQGKETTIDNVKVEIKAHVQQEHSWDKHLTANASCQSTNLILMFWRIFFLQDIEVLTDIFVAWGRQAGWAASALSRPFVRRRFWRKAEKRYPLSELEIVKWGSQVRRMLWFLQIRVRILMLTLALGKGTLTQSAGRSEGSGQTRSFLEQNAWSVVLSAKSLSYILFLCICFYLFLSLLISFYPAWSWFWNVWIGIDRTNFSTPRFCGIDSNLGDLFRLDCRCCVVKASLVSWDSNTSTLKQMTRRMATWGEWGAGSFW